MKLVLQNCGNRKKRSMNAIRSRKRKYNVVFTVLFILTNSWTHNNFSGVHHSHQFKKKSSMIVRTIFSKISKIWSNNPMTHLYRTQASKNVNLSLEMIRIYQPKLIFEEQRWFCILYSTMFILSMIIIILIRPFKSIQFN